MVCNILERFATLQTGDTIIFSKNPDGSFTVEMRK